MISKKFIDNDTKTENVSTFFFSSSTLRSLEELVQISGDE